jgi:hypothetical protein
VLQSVKRYQRLQRSSGRFGKASGGGMPSQVRRNFSVETILPPHKAQTLVTTARTIDQERWEVSALRFPSWILDNCLLVAFSITAFYQKSKYCLSAGFCQYLEGISCFANTTVYTLYIPSLSSPSSPAGSALLLVSRPKRRCSLCAVFSFLLYCL